MVRLILSSASVGRLTATTPPPRRTSTAATLCAAIIGLLAGSGMGCQGPSSSPTRLELDVPKDLLARDWEEGPRRDAIEAELERSAKRFVEKLFPGEPMPRSLGQPVPPAAAIAKGVRDAARGGAKLATHEEPPAWWKGVQRPPEDFAHELPQPHPIQVRRGETLALLAKWSSSSVDAIRDDNRDVLKQRRWLKVGDPLVLTMSRGQRLRFETSRERFQAERLEAYFSKRFIDKVVLYVVKRGDVIASVAREFGDVPTWLLEEFNQADFRSLHAGDEILIPVVRELRRGQHQPPALAVVDEHGDPLTPDRRAVLDRRMATELMGKARMAIDDSNVFERDVDPRGGGLVGAGQLLPDTDRSRPLRAPPKAPPVAFVRPEPKPTPSTPASMRDVLVKRGETLSHFASWAGLKLHDVLDANPGLDPARMRVGQRVRVPLTDSGWLTFMEARAAKHGGNGRAPEAQNAEAEAARKPLREPVAAVRTPAPEPAAETVARPESVASAPAPSGRTHKVRPGDTTGAIAVKYGITLKALSAVNPGRDMDRIRVGEKLKLP